MTAFSYFYEIHNVNDASEIVSALNQPATEDADISRSDIAYECLQSLYYEKGDKEISSELVPSSTHKGINFYPVQEI